MHSIFRIIYEILKELREIFLKEKMKKIKYPIIVRLCFSNY